MYSGGNVLNIRGVKKVIPAWDALALADMKLERISF